ncbi:MAG: transglutaminase-like cysteine peptidase [Rhodospirillales bacterium]|nr:transglutaminase-like cysteine peptidase [Rhodospirillales bacterium]
MRMPILRQFLPRALCAVMLLSVPLLSIRPDAATAAPMRPSFLHSREIRSDDTSRFVAWHAALSRHVAESAASQPRRYQEWLAFLERIADHDPRRQLIAVNRFVNAIRYESDRRNWGVQDHWASPAEFLGRAAGDCEDFVIAKYLSLHALGWPDDALRFVAVNDRKNGDDHAILVAFYDAKVLVLDSSFENVMEADQVPHYRPIYSLNRSHWWLHRKAPRP